MDVVKSFERDTSLFLNETVGSLQGKGVLVGLSGGADSVSLLTVLVSLSAKMGFSVHALHVNHGIRGAEADADEVFCIKLCASYEVPLTVVREDIPMLAAKNKQSLELCGREYRYRAFESYCDKHNIDYIATAHNANDNAETVLYNLIRGSGIDGLKGIPAKRGKIIRPILCMERERIEQYLAALGQDYVVDSTNKDDDYTRNYIRNTLMPACTRINKECLSAINRASNVICDDAAYLDSVADEAISKGKSLMELSPPIRARVLRKAFSEKFGKTLENSHILSLQKALVSDGCSFVSLPGGVTAQVCGGKVDFNVSYTVLEKAFVNFGENDLGSGVKLTLRREFNGSNVARINIDAVVGRLFVRPRQAGDKITVRGIGKSIKKCFIDKKIPAPMRESVPLLCDDLGIIYVPFIGVCDRVYPKKGDAFVTVSVAFNERFGLKE